MSEARPFQVDLKGIVDLLGRHIYSSPRVYVRELLQNGVDAITARRLYCEEHGLETRADWGVSIFPATAAHPEFVLTDQGIGLTADEVTDLLATVGRSSKRDILDMARTDYLGQFGIGLLSCFMVSDKIRILSQSASGAPAVEWVGSGQGTFEVRELDEALPVGTQVYLTGTFDSADMLTDPTVRTLARDYGQFLPVPVTVVTRAENRSPDGTGPSLVGATTDLISGPPVFDETDHQRLADYARDELGFEPLDVVDLAAPGTGTTGKGFVLPFSPPPNAHQSTRVYLSRMLLSQQVDDILPDWAFFVRAVVDSTGLSPTASREGIVDDSNLEYTREQLGGCVRGWLMDLAAHHPHRFAALLAVHEQAIKQLVLHDEQMASIFLGWLSVETSAGRMSLDRLVKTSPTVRYTDTLDEFRQVASLADAEAPLVNGGYVHDADLVRLLPQVYPSVVVTQVDVLAELDRLDPPDLADRTLAVDLEDRATRVLESRQCQAVVRLIVDQDVPSLFVADPEVFRHIDRGRASEAVRSDGIWAQILAQTDSFALSRSAYAETGFTTRLCLNWANPLVRSLAACPDEAVFSRCVQLLYVQSQLAGSYPLTPADRALMTSALSDLVALTTLSTTLSAHDGGTDDVP